MTSLWLWLGVIVSVLGSSAGSLYMPLIAPGLLFGALVLAPQAGPGERKLLRQAALVALSGVTYVGTFFIGVTALGKLVGNSVFLGIGLVGALLTCAFAQRLLPVKLPPRRWIEAAVIGALSGGALLLSMGGGALSLTSQVAGFGPFVPCFLIWQGGMALTLFRPDRNGSK